MHAVRSDGRRGRRGRVGLRAWLGSGRLAHRAADALATVAWLSLTALASGVALGGGA